MQEPYWLAPGGGDSNSRRWLCALASPVKRTGLVPSGDGPCMALTAPPSRPPASAPTPRPLRRCARWRRLPMSRWRTALLSVGGCCGAPQRRATPCSLHSIACAPAERATPPLERARRFFVRARQVRTGLAQTASIGRWANCKNTSRAGMSGVVSRWLGGVDSLQDIAERLLRVQIENRPAIDVIRLYDSPGTLFYCDPPYVHSTRGDTKSYGFEMDISQHTELADALRQCLGKAAISGYRCDLMDDLYRDWHRHDAPVKCCHSVKQSRQEALWTNY